MNQLRIRLEELRADYANTQGQPFAYFYCPLLFKDEDVDLCKAHVVNQAFPKSARAWTVQRSDVDSFYGSTFEAEFILTQYNSVSAVEVISDRKLQSRFRAQIVREGEGIEHFPPTGGHIPKEFTLMELQHGGQSTLVVVKTSEDGVLTYSGQRWEINFSKDMRIAALVSLIKAAHLTLFEMLGYRYAVTAGAELVGHQILGKFFSDNRGKSKGDILRNAKGFFREFQHMVRPILRCGIELAGSVTDRTFMVCLGSTGRSWGLIVFVKTGERLHAVIVPTLAETVPVFLDFLRGNGEVFHANVCVFEPSGDRWRVDTRSMEMSWPKTGILYPD
ncbi:MAG TPA: hypothetical protein VN812_11665 [Candidatus Acidoferrales bacterium]|nr:hypothetical protein [Candidatus Acidoferrales bacterium]